MKPWKELRACPCDAPIAKAILGQHLLHVNNDQARRGARVTGGIESPYSSLPRSGIHLRRLAASLAKDSANSPSTSASTRRYQEVTGSLLGPAIWFAFRSPSLMLAPH
jgi:hypothetical protein